MLAKLRRLFAAHDKQFRPPVYEDEPWQSEADEELAYMHRSLVVSKRLGMPP